MKNHLFTANVLFTVSVCFFVSMKALNYTDLEPIHFENCPFKHLCFEIGNASFKNRLCECDKACTKFGDCCIDVDTSNSILSQTCMRYGISNYEGVYVINYCSGRYGNFHEVSLKCLRDDFKDPFMSTPVTDISSGQTYLNQYCAICNDVDPSSIVIWKLYIAFNDKSLDTKSISEYEFQYRDDIKKWGFSKFGNFTTCKFLYDRPLAVSGVGRQCRYNLISSCSKSWYLPKYRKECDTYMAVVTDHANNIYKNPHCATCNNVPNGDIKCLSSISTYSINAPFNFVLLVNVSTGIEGKNKTKDDELSDNLGRDRKKGNNNWYISRNGTRREEYRPSHEDERRPRRPVSLIGNRNRNTFDLSQLVDSNRQDGRIVGVLSFSLAHLLDINTQDGRIVGVIRPIISKSCPSQEIYDPFFKRCRKLHCGIPGYTARRGKCVEK